MIVNVTQADINDGIMGSCGACPVAKALTRSLGGCVRVGYCTFTMQNGSEVYRLPPEARDWIMDFDCGFHVAPFGFNLEVQE